MRVLLSEDHQLTRTGLRFLLKDVSGVTEVLEAADSNETLQAMRKQPADVLVLHINLPGLNKFKGVSRLRRQYPETRIVILSARWNREFVRQAFLAGANGVLMKRDAVADLRQAFDAVQRG